MIVKLKLLKYIKEIYKKHSLIMIVIILLLATIFLIYFGFYIYDKNFINENQLGYMGSIIGGCLTLIGVCWTIHFESQQLQKERELDIRTKYFPSLSVDVEENNSSINDMCSSIDLIIDDNNFIKQYTNCNYLIKIKNASQYDLHIDNWVVKSYNIKSLNQDLSFDESNINCSILNNGDKKFIASGEFIYLKIRFSSLKKGTKFTKTNNRLSIITINFDVTILVRGVIADNPHEYYLNFDVDIKYDCYKNKYSCKIHNLLLTTKI